MTINVVCMGCGKRLSAPTEYAGKRARCKSCGATIEIPLPEIDEAIPVLQPVDMSFEIKIGTVTSSCGEMIVNFKMKGDGVAHVVLFCHDPNSRRSGQLLMLQEHEYAHFKAVFAKLDETLDSLRNSGKIPKKLFKS